MTMELAVDIMRNLLQTGLILSIPILGTASCNWPCSQFHPIDYQSSGANSHLCAETGLRLPCHRNFRKFHS